MHTGYHRRRAWEARVMLLVAGVPLLLLTAWLVALVGAPALAIAVLVVLGLSELVGAWLIWQSKP
jgi:hypothetical protein